ncbi:MAG TPA: ATP-binding protein [Pyrinomonadaceae bacterium]|nr:ATP-binding protein [Pyrinomonadaceae bacterium]
MGIRGRLIILAVGVAVPLVLVGIADLRGMWRVSRSQLDESVKQQAELAAVAFERWVDAQRQPLTMIAAMAADERVEPAAFNVNLRYVVETRPHWIDLHVLGPAGENLTTQPTGREPLPPALTQHLLAEVTRRSSWTVATDRTLDEARPTFAVAVPVKGGGAVVARVDGAAMRELFQDVNLTERSVIGVFDSEGRVLYRKQTTETPVDMHITGTPLLTALGDERRRALGDKRAAVIEVESPYDGVRRVYGIARAGVTDCVVIVGIPSAALYEPAQKQLTRHLYFSLLALFCAVIAALIVARGIVLSVRRLRSAAQALGTGDLSARAPVRGGGEIGQLGTVFNTMAEQIAEREERLKELDRLKSEFVSSVSHELRTPLTTIKTLTRVLQRGGQTESERQEYLGTIAAECDRQIDLVLNLLDLSRIESGAYKFSFSKVDVGEVVRSCLVTERHAADTHNLSLSADVMDDLPYVLGDRSALRRVLSSLIENGIKYTPDGGRIVVAARACAGGEVVLSVKDDGCGIKLEDLPHVFEKFYRGRPASDGGESFDSPDACFETPGVGLGLYLTRTIVEHLGGRITVENNGEKQRGVTFKIYLPAWREENESGVLSEEKTDVEALAGG